MIPSNVTNIIQTINMNLLKTLMLLSAFNVSFASMRRRRNMYNNRPCGPGQKAVLSASKKTVLDCIQCEVNKFRPDPKHSSENCIQCKPGRQSSPDKSYCIGDVCRAGTYGISDSFGCKECNAGHYSDIGEFKCKACESGRYNTQPKQSTCMGEMCPEGKFGLHAQTNSNNVGVCNTCPAGKWSSKGAEICTECPEGKWSQENAGHCNDHKKCPVGSYNIVEPHSEIYNIKCKRCIYFSDTYFAAYLVAVIIAILNTSLFIYNVKEHCYVLCFLISPAAWAIALTTCNYYPHNTPAIISIIMNTFCLIPIVNITAKKVTKYYTKYKANAHENHITNKQNINVASNSHCVV